MGEDPRPTIRTLLLATTVALSACATGPPKFDGEVIWRVNDFHPIEMPEPREAPRYWQAIDASVLRPVSRALHMEPTVAAQNVNAWGHVPNSSWYTNRMSLASLTPARVARGPCTKASMPRDSEWRIEEVVDEEKRPEVRVAATAADGTEGTYRVSVDGRRQPQRATAADAIASRIYWAAGFETPCMRVRYIDPDRLVPGDGVAREDLRAFLDHAFRRADGRIRVLVSRQLPGVPLGPFEFEGTRADDPNDVIPHQNRRELRGSRLVAAWINHFDVRERTTFTSFIRDDDTSLGYVQHFFQDFDDALGSLGPTAGVSRRFGFTYYFDPGQILADLFTLGLIHRPWYDVRLSEEAPIFGYFSAEPFDPTGWVPGFPNLAFRRMDDRDAFWATNIISRFSEAHIRRLVDVAKFTRADNADYLHRVLVARRDAIVETYFTRMSPMVEPTVEAGSFCVADAWVARGFGTAKRATYQLRRTNPGNRADVEWRTLAVEPGENGRICVPVPPPSKRFRRGTDLVVQMRVRREGQAGYARPARFYLRPTENGRTYEVVGILRVGDEP